MSAAAAKTLPFKREEPLVDCAFTTRSSEVHVRTGPDNDSVNTSVALRMEDNLSPKVSNPVAVHWEMFRFRTGNGEPERIDLHVGSHPDMSFRLDEVEGFATALYQAVQLAKKQGYLPAVAGGAQS
jgi:hypothetical protein